MKELIWLGNRDAEGAIYVGKERGKCWLAVNDEKDKRRYLIDDRLYEQIEKDLQEQIKRGRFVQP